MKRRHRLSRSRDFDAVYRKGRSVSTRYLVLYAFPRDEEEQALEPEPRLGLAISRKVGGAVARNRLKRRLREVFTALADKVQPGYDYVLVARPGLAEAAEEGGHSWLADRVADVFRLLDASPQGARA